MQTDNAEQVGMHVFEKARLGVAPFRFIGCEEKRGPIRLANGTEIGYAGQPMGTCDYCGQGIAICCSILSADGRKFVVGSDCVARTGDAGIIRAYKNSPDLRAMKRAKSAALTARKNAEIELLMVEKKNVLLAVMIPTWDGKSREPAYDYLVRVLPRCGAAGKARYLKFIKKLITA